MRWWRRRLGFPPWLLFGVLAVAFGTWGFTQVDSAPGSSPIHHLDVFQSFVASINLFGLSLGAAGSLGVKLNWPLIVAAVLAAGLTIRALLALTGSRIRRWYLSNRLRGHVVVCGAGALGTRLAQELDGLHDVVLVDSDADAVGLAAAPDRYAWRLQGDATLPATLIGAGIEHAAELLVVTPDDYVNSLIVTAAQRVNTRARVMVQVEEPGLTRFFEERIQLDEEGSRPEPSGAAARPLQVSPFSTNAVAARALLVDEQADGEWHEQPGSLLRVIDAAAPHLLLAGDHPFLDAVMLEGLRRWRSLALARAAASTAPEPLPPLRMSVYGPAAVARVERLRNRWAPEPELLELYCRDLPEGGQGAIETDDWLRRLRGDRSHDSRAGEFVSHAIVACDSELDAISLALAVGRALGAGVPLLRVSMLGTGELDTRIHDYTMASRHRATTSVTSLPELACRGDAIRRHASLEDRLIDELCRRGAQHDSAREAIDRLMAQAELEIHSDPAWRFSVREIPLLRALLDDEGVSLEAFVAAGVALDLGSAPTLAMSAERLLTAPAEDAPAMARAWRGRLAPAELHEAAFAACCEYARATRDPEALRETRSRFASLAGDVDAVTRLLELREFVTLPRAVDKAREEVLRAVPGDQADALARKLERLKQALRQRDKLLRGAQADRLAEFEQVAIFAGAAGGHALTGDALDTLSKLLGPPEARQAGGHSRTATPLAAPGDSRRGARGDADGLLPEAERFQTLRGFDGVVLSGGTASGVSGIAARAANAYDVALVGYVPAGKGDAELYANLRETEAADFSELEPLAMWADILAAGISPAEVSLVACPGGPITRAEVLLARALGARVGWLDPEGEAPLALDDDLPGGAEDIIELPPDAMSVRALICWSELEDPELRDHVAKLTHAEYRSKQPPERLASDPACATWDRLLPVFRASNRAQADDITNKLAMVGLCIERLDSGGRRLELSDKQIQLLAEMEHGRYVVDRLRAGWQLGDRDANRGRSPYFVPWTELSAAERYWDVSAVETIAGALHSFGYGVTPIDAAGRKPAGRGSG
jgi:voltage-gated potassium channel Kch